MTLTQLNAFVLVARLGSVTAAAAALGVTEPAVSQALTALRQHLGDQLILRNGPAMTLTPAGSRLLGIASQMVALGAEAHAVVRQAKGAAEQLRVVATSTVAEFIAGPLLEAFGQRSGGTVEVSTGVAASTEMAVLVASRLADVALGPDLAGRPFRELISQPVFRGKLVVVAGRQFRRRGGPAAWRWLVDPAGADPGSDVSQLLRQLGVPEDRVRVFANQTAAWAAAADGQGVAPAASHLVAALLRRGELRPVSLSFSQMDTNLYATVLSGERRSPAATALLNFLATPEATRLMHSPNAGVPPSRFRPPVYVTIWS